MPLSTISRVDFDADVSHTRGEVKRPAGPKRKGANPRYEADPAAMRFVVSEETGSTAGLTILAQALAAYSES